MEAVTCPEPPPSKPTRRCVVLPLSLPDPGPRVEKILLAVCRRACLVLLTRHCNDCIQELGRCYLGIPWLHVLCTFLRPAPLAPCHSVDLSVRSRQVRITKYGVRLVYSTPHCIATCTRGKRRWTDQQARARALQGGNPRPHLLPPIHEVGKIVNARSWRLLYTPNCNFKSRRQRPQKSRRQADRMRQSRSRLRCNVRRLQTRRLLESVKPLRRGSCQGQPCP